jgi:hypothetical protein
MASKPRRKRNNKQKPEFGSVMTKDGKRLQIPLNRKARRVDAREHRKEKLAARGGLL